MNTNILVFGLTRMRIESESTASVADALSIAVQFNLFGEQKFKIMITKNAHLLIAVGFMRRPSDDL